MTRIPRTVAALMAVVFGAALAFSAAAPVAIAEEGDITWSVQPANENGPDGRSWIELTLDPGEQVTEHLALRNLSATEVTFAIKAADGYLTENGRFNMLPSDATSVDAGTWVEGPETITVAANATAIVAFTITVPENATPGDHAAGIAATLQSLGADGNGTQVAVESRVGFPIMTRVTGELQPSLDIKPVQIAYDVSWNPFAPGRITAVYELVNDGNVRIQAQPVVESQGQREAAEADASPLELLPGETRQITATVQGVWPLFFAPVQISIDPTMVALGSDPQPADRVVRDFGVWAVPLPQLLVLVGIALVVTALLVGRRRSKLKVEAMLAEAREAGRREVQ